jgi:chromosome partitioning protein
LYAILPVKTIAFVSGKGGVGKTTLAFLLGTALTRAGRRVRYLDLDPNESLKGLLAEHRVADVDDPEFTIVDTPPRLDTKQVVAVIKTADVICIPTRPTVADRPLAQHTALAVAELRHPEAKALLVFNQVRRGTLASKQVDALARLYPFFNRGGAENEALAAWRMRFSHAGRIP